MIFCVDMLKIRFNHFPISESHLVGQLYLRLARWFNRCEMYVCVFVYVFLVETTLQMKCISSVWQNVWPMRIYGSWKCLNTDGFVELLFPLVELQWQKNELSITKVVKQFSNCSLYVTSEPCIMCAFALSSLGILLQIINCSSIIVCLFYILSNSIICQI